MYTEDEARTNWCPIRAKINADKGTITLYEGNQTEYCLASRCMMWRWKEEHINREGYCGVNVVLNA